MTCQRPQKGHGMSYARNRRPVSAISRLASRQASGLVSNLGILPLSQSSRFFRIRYLCFSWSFLHSSEQCRFLTPPASSA